MELKLSDAILLGSMLGPQVRRATAGANGGTCAIGAACAALGLGNDVRRLEWTFPRLKQVVSEEGRTLSSLIVEMNDRRYLTREQIAEQLVLNGWDCEARCEYASEDETCRIAEFCAYLRGDGPPSAWLGARNAS